MPCNSSVEHHLFLLLPHHHPHLQNPTAKYVIHNLRRALLMPAFLGTLICGHISLVIAWSFSCLLFNLYSIFLWLSVDWFGHFYLFIYFFCELLGSGKLFFLIRYELFLHSLLLVASYLTNVWFPWSIVISTYTADCQSTRYSFCVVNHFRDVVISALSFQTNISFSVFLTVPFFPLILILVTVGCQIKWENW